MSVTILICARDAAPTIERAVASAWSEPEARLLVIDDHSRDDTAARAQRIAGRRVSIIRAPDPGGVGLARQAGLDACETEFAAWLDADDEWIPGRAARIEAALAAGADVFAEPIELADGATGACLRRLEVPPFVRREVVPARLFERNHLPGDSQVGFRVATFRSAGGYDAGLFTAESFDLLLRAVARGARFAYGDVVGYRMFTYPDSMSRHLDRQRTSLAAALRKHDYEAVRRLCLEAGEPPRVAAWVLVSMALFREEPEAALQFLEQASPDEADPQQVLEPEGPWPFPEGWRRAFQRGTCLLLLGRKADEAEGELRRAQAIEPTAEAANNLGVALARQGRLAAALACWEEAGQRFPGYLDARLNRQEPRHERITTHPLRRQPSRSEY